MYRNAFLLTLFHLCGVIFVCVGLLCVLAVLSAYLLGPDGSPSWLYSNVWPHSAQILMGASLCTVFGFALLLFAKQREAMKGQGYELW